MATSFEKKLDKDFWYYLTLAKEVYENFSTDDEKNSCEVWLCRLSGKSFLTVEEKRDRNIYLSRLLLQMQNGKLQGIFLEMPPDGPLKPAFSVFGLPAEIEELKSFEKKGFRIDPNIVSVSDDLFESSRDGRTYIATKKVPNGLMAFMAVTVTENEPLWVDQSASKFAKVPSFDKSDHRETKKTCAGRFVKRLAQFERIPLSELRKSPKEREKVLEWMDQIIDGCNKWLRKEDPKNKDLETLFELLYEDYKNDPEKSKIIEMKRDMRDILMKDIRNKITKRRDVIAKRELILDQYEAEEYTEERLPDRQIDEIWLKCAMRPMKASVEKALKAIYPPELVKRFLELLVQDRIDIIGSRETETEKQVEKLKNDSLKQVEEEAQKLKIMQSKYKELYCLYTKVQDYVTGAQKKLEENGGENEIQLRREEVEELKKNFESEMEEQKITYEIKRAEKHELKMKLKETNEAMALMKDKIQKLNAEFQCERLEASAKKEKLEEKLRKENRKLRQQTKKWQSLDEC